MIPPSTQLATYQLNERGEFPSNWKGRAVLQAEQGQNSHYDLPAIGMHLGQQNIPLDEQLRNHRVKGELNPGHKNVEVHCNAALGGLIGRFVLARRPEEHVLRDFVFASK